MCGLPAWPYPKFCAHRGAGKLAPENTLAAFRLGYEHGYRMAEFDVKLSADGVAFLLHDDTLDRTTNRKGRADALTWRELALADAGTWHSPEYAGEPLASLAAVAAWSRARHVRMNIEIKQKRPSIVKPFLDAIERSGVPAQNLLIASFYTAVLKEFRNECKQRNLQIATSASTWEWVRFYLGNYLLHLPYRPPTDALQMAERLPVIRFWLMTRGFIQKAHDVGLRVHAWTVDDPNDMKRAIANGVDGIITNFPTRLRAIVDELDRRGRRGV